MATQALNMVVDDIFNTYAKNQSYLTYSEWQSWLSDLPGIN